MDPITVLISLYKGYGLGDAVQMSAVLRHIRHFRPHWKIDFLAEPGRESVGRGIVHNVFSYGQPYPSEYYDLEVQIVLYDTITNWPDRPNTRVVSCLHERFGIEWDSRFARYQILVRPETLAKVQVPDNSIAIHYQGDSAKDKKDLSHSQISDLSEFIRKLGFVPLILDWRNDHKYIIERAVYFRADGGNDAEMQCAVISKCKAFIGIDSGPGKCASATETPTLITWTGHHPVPFHDPAPNTTHNIPLGYKGLEPQYKECSFFEQNYNVQFYSDPVEGIKQWISKTL